MFNALKELNSIYLKTQKQTGMSRGVSLRTFRAAHKHAMITSKIISSLAKSSGVVCDFSDLRRLRNIANTHGLNKALMLFANPNNNVISRIVKNIPSNESLDAVSIGKSDRRTKAALEGMDESLQSEPKLISDWTHASAEDIDQLLTAVEDQMKDIGEAISHYLEVLETMDTSEEDLSSEVEAIPYEASVSRLDALLDILPDLDAIVSDPTDSDAMSIYREKLNNLIEKTSSILGIGIDAENPHMLVEAPLSDEYTPKQSTLTALGYTLENTIELLKKADELVDEINGLIERKESMVSRLHTTADVIATVDNTVPPAVDGAIPEDNDDTDTAVVDDGGLTQADIYHSQIASHLYCLSVVIGASVDAVQEVLEVADALSDDDNEDVIVVTEVT